MAQLIISSEESQEGDAVCLICPALECPYFGQFTPTSITHELLILIPR